MLNAQPKINLDDVDHSDFSHQMPSPNIAGASDADYDVKLAALRAEIQLGIDDINAGRAIKLDMTQLDEFFDKL